MDLMTNDTEQRERLLKQRDENRARLDQVRLAAREGKDKSHQLALQTQQLQTQSTSLKNALERLRQQLSQFKERRAAIEEQLALGDDPFMELQAELEAKLEARLNVEDELRNARRAQEDCEHDLRASEKKRSEAEQSAQSVRSELERNRMDWQGMRVQRETLQNQLKEAQYDLEIVVAELPLEANEEQWNADLEWIADRKSV